MVTEGVYASCTRRITHFRRPVGKHRDPRLWLSTWFPEGRQQRIVDPCDTQSGKSILLNTFLCMSGAVTRVWSSLEIEELFLSRDGSEVGSRWFLPLVCPRGPRLDSLLHEPFSLGDGESVNFPISCCPFLFFSFLLFFLFLLLDRRQPGIRMGGPREQG